MDDHKTERQATWLVEKATNRIVAALSGFDPLTGMTALSQVLYAAMSAVDADPLAACVQLLTALKEYHEKTANNQPKASPIVTP